MFSFVSDLFSRRSIAIVLTLAVVATLLSVIPPLPASPASAAPKPPVPTSVTLAIDKTQILVGESATLTATVNNTLTGTGATLTVTDQTTGAVLKSCTTGTTCVVSANFASGGPHTYVAKVLRLVSNTVTLTKVAWTVALTADKTSFSVGQTVTFTATANQNVGNTSGAYMLYIFDKTTGARLTSCSMGTTCSVTPSSLFYSGNPHVYVAMVAQAGTPTFATVSNVQATSADFTLTRAPWIVTLTTNKPDFATGETVTLTSTTNQDIGLTTAYYSTYIFDATTGARLATCTSGTACSYSGVLFTAGSPHTYVAMVARAGTPTYSSVSETQGTSNPVVVQRKTWTVGLTASTSTFAAGQAVTLTAVANQVPNAGGGRYAIFIYDQTTNTKLASCTSSTTCTYSSSAIFLTGGPHTYVAVVAPDTSTTYTTLADVQATSNQLVVSRQAWTVSLTADKTVFASGEPVTFTLTANQDLGQTQNRYYGRVWDVTANDWVWGSCSARVCTIAMTPFYTGAPHEYIAVISEASAGSLSQQSDVQAVSSSVNVARMAWSVQIRSSVTKGSGGLYTVTIILWANQRVGIYTNSAYNYLLVDLATGTPYNCPTSGDWWSCSFTYNASTLDPPRAWQGYVTNGWAFSDTQAVTNGFSADLGFGSDASEGIGGSNASEKRCQCSHADPVNTATGEFYLPSTDTTLPGVGPNLSVSRTYSSTAAATDGPFGFGWAANFTSRLSVVVPGDTTDPLPRQVKITQENGATVTFFEGSDKTYFASARVMAKLSFDSASQTWTFTRASREVFTFTATGALASVRDVYGNTLSLTRNGSGQVTGVTAPGGRSITLAWTGNHVSQLTDSAGRSVSYTYTAGNLTAVTGVDGRVTSYGYDGAHYMTSVTTPGARTTTNVYDGTHRVTSQTDPIGRVTTFAYGASTTMTGPDGSKTVETYTSGQLTSQTKAATTALAATTSHVWDAAGNISSTTDPRGKVTSFTYDVDGNMLTKTDPLGRVTRWTYDANRHPLTVKDAMGRQTTFAYDAVGNLIFSTSPSGLQTGWTFNANGTVATVTNASGKITSYAYDTAGRMTSVTDPDGRTTSLAYNAAGIVTSQTVPGGAVTTITPDAAGRTLSTLDPNNHETAYTYSTAGDLLLTLDAMGRTTSATYDAAGQVITSTDAAGKVTGYAYTPAGYLASVTDANNHTSSRTYDALGRVATTTDPLSRTTTYAYDLAGHLVSTALPSGSVNAAVYDAAGQLVQATNALGKSSTFAYNLAGQPLSSTDPLGRVTSSSYTNDGLLDTVTLPGNSTQRYGYNSQGQPVTFTNADGKVATYSYGNSGLLLSKTEPGGLTTSYAYDTAGRPSVVTQPGGSTATYGYDPAGQLLQIDYSGTAGVDATYTYDAVGHPLTMADATGPSSFSYDVVGRLASETNGAGATTGYGYDEVGQLTSISYPGARVASYSYDVAGQMASVSDWSNNTTAFTWTADGQLATQVTPDGVTQTNGYDATGQVTSIADATSAGSLAQFSYGYDFADQLTANTSTLDGATIASDYGYDPISQLTSVTTTPAGGSATVAAPSASAAGLLTATVGGDTLAYNAAQQVVSSTPVFGAATAFAYDGRGSRLSATTATAATAYAYTTSGALASVTTPTTAVSYTSDARNLRQSRTVGGVTSQFTWSSVGGLPLLLDDGVHAYLYGPSSTPIAQLDDSTGAAQYLHADLLGTPRLITNATGDAVGTASYDAFGNRTTRSGIQSAFGFTGNLVDQLTGLLYLRARDYDAATGQFLTVDPAVDRTRQPYAYVGNNPVTRTDPSGLDWLDDQVGVPIVVLAGLVTNGYAWLVLASDDPESQIVGGWMLGQSGPDTTYGEGSGLITDMKSMDETWAARGEIVQQLHEGTYVGPIDASYAAGKPGLQNPKFMADMFTYLDWVNSDEQARLRAALGTYDLSASVVCIDDDGTAIVEFSGSNTTSLGSAFGFNPETRAFLNGFAEVTGLGTAVTQHFTWTERVRS